MDKDTAVGVHINRARTTRAILGYRGRFGGDIGDDDLVAADDAEA